MNTYNYSKDQVKALDAFDRFIRYGGKDFILCGAAGTGKSTIVRDMTAGHDAVYAAPTGKAAKVISRKAGVEACTLHSLFMKPICHPKVEQANLLLRQAKERGIERIINMAEDHLSEMKRKHPGVKFVERDDIETIPLLVCDEASMVDNRMMAIAKKNCERILWIGDHFQLPPVRQNKGEGSIVSVARADAILEEIHRQAEDSDVLRWATDIRRHGYSDACYISKSDFTERSRDGAQVLVGYHKSRAFVSAKIRERKIGDWRSLPQAGEPLLVLRNDHDLGIMNGEVIKCISFEKVGRQCRIIAETDEGVIDFNISNSEFENVIDMDQSDRRQSCKIGFGYVLTVHKSQGSEWEDVVVVDDWRKKSDDYKNWLYTAVTRASERVGVCDFGFDLVNHWNKMKGN